MNATPSDDCSRDEVSYQQATSVIVSLLCLIEMQIKTYLCGIVGIVFYLLSLLLWSVIIRMKCYIAAHGKCNVFACY